MSEALTVRPPASGPWPPGTLPLGRALIILPTLNEEAGLAKTLLEIGHVPSFSQGRLPDVLIVDGHSTDRTLEVASHFPCTVLTQRNRGKGAAVREGLAWASAHGYAAAALLDADATYPADRLPALFRLLSLGADVVVGLRRPEYTTTRSPRDLVHRIGNGGLNLWAALFGRGPILDVCSGFWGVRTSVLPRLALDSNGFEIESELFVKSFRLGLRVVQIPVSYRERTGLAKLQAGRDGARIFLSIIRQSHRGGQLRRAGRRAPSALAGAAPRSVGLASMVLALALTLDAERVRISSTEQRRREAVAISEGLADAQIATELLTDGPSTASSPPTQEVRRSPGRRATLRVTLLSPPSPGSSAPTALVALPQGRRLVRLGIRGISAPPTSDVGIRSGFPGRSGHAPGLFQILGATVDPSGVQQVLALLAANFSASGLGSPNAVGRSMRSIPQLSVGGLPSGSEHRPAGSGW